MKLARWGNSLAIRLPASVIEALELQEGDDIEVDIAGTRRLEVRRAEDAAQTLARLRKYRGRLPAGFRFDRLEANAR
jgi:antitoxin MazE